MKNCKLLRVCASSCVFLLGSHMATAFVIQPHRKRIAPERRTSSSRTRDFPELLSPPPSSTELSLSSPRLEWYRSKLAHLSLKDIWTGLKKIFPLSTLHRFRSSETLEGGSENSISESSQTKRSLSADAVVDENNHPDGPRWAIAASATDLSGEWKPVVTPAFKRDYDRYLTSCGEGILFRKALLAAIGLGKEIYAQREGGRELSITGVTPVKQWERLLVASGAELDSSEYQPVHTSFRDPDGDTVEVEAWWEDNGTVHTSILSGKPRIKGGKFVSKRYLLPDNPDILVCLATFHPPEDGGSRFKKDSVEWRFERQK